jgi:hypothetical protein
MGIFPNPMRACARFVFVYFKKTLDHPSPALWPKASDQVVSPGPPWSDLGPLWPDAQQDEQLWQLKYPNLYRETVGSVKRQCLCSA